MITNATLVVIVIVIAFHLQISRFPTQHLPDVLCQMMCQVDAWPSNNPSHFGFVIGITIGVTVTQISP
jgi:hypothetical protein